MLMFLKITLFSFWFYYLSMYSLDTVVKPSYALSPPAPPPSLFLYDCFLPFHSLFLQGSILYVYFFLYSFNFF